MLASTPVCPANILRSALLAHLSLDNLSILTASVNQSFTMMVLVYNARRVIIHVNLALVPINAILVKLM